jgi:feruloyl esterase
MTRLFLALLVPAFIAGCATSTTPLMGGDARTACAAFTGVRIAPALIRIPSGAATVDSAELMQPAPLTVAERGPTPAATITPANPLYCKVRGHIAPLDPAAPPIQFQLNLPAQWNGRAVQYGGGGFNGVLVTGLGLVPGAPFAAPSPLAKGYVTYGTDSGHQNKPGEPPQAFALNDEALLNFAHASYKKVRDTAVALIHRAYGIGPRYVYYVGSSEGGREGLTMAQRYPNDFDGVFSRVPVIAWTGLQHAGLRDGLATMGPGWIRPEQTAEVQRAVLAACDALDGTPDGIVSDPVACRARFDIASLRCTAGAPPTCLSDAQVAAVQTLQSPLLLDVQLANGQSDYPGRGPGGEALPSYASTGGWGAWWLGQGPPTLPPKPGQGNAWVYGAGAIQYFYARDAKFDVRNWRPAAHAARVREVSELMDSTNPDLGVFQKRGGKLLMLEHMADYAQSPYAGIAYFNAVQQTLGAERTESFARLYTAPGVDHVGTGAPANIDMLDVLVDWVEHSRPPVGLTISEQDAKPPFAVQRSRPLCTWPLVPRFQGGSDRQAGNFLCQP